MFFVLWKWNVHIKSFVFKANSALRTQTAKLAKASQAVSGLVMRGFKGSAGAKDTKQHKMHSTVIQKFSKLCLFYFLPICLFQKSDMPYKLVGNNILVANWTMNMRPGRDHMSAPQQFGLSSCGSYWQAVVEMDNAWTSDFGLRKSKAV